MKKAEKELQKFIEQPKYREKIILKLHKDEDKSYKSKIQIAEKEKKKALNKRTMEIHRIEKERWKNFANGQLKINRTEGKAKIHNSEFLFTKIRGAELNIQTGFRIEKKDNSKSKKHTSVGGAIVGGMVAGPIGVVVGGTALGKTTTKGTSVSNSIPTCIHMGIVVNIDGFPSEITLIKSEVDQSSSTYSSAYNTAQNIISELREISKTEVPENFPRVEDEPSVKFIDKQIKEANEKLEYAINDKPQYKIPNLYRMKETSHMSDEEYLEYLKSEDEKREKNTSKKEWNTQNRKREPFNYQDKLMIVFKILKNIILWGVTVFCAFMTLGSVVIVPEEGMRYVITGIVFAIYTIMACPIITEKTKRIEKLRLYRKFKIIIAILIFVLWVALL